MERRGVRGGGGGGLEALEENGGRGRMQGGKSE